MADEIPEATATSRIEELPWFKEALAKSELDMAATPEAFQPTWFRPYVKGIA